MFQVCSEIEIAKSREFIIYLRFELTSIEKGSFYAFIFSVKEERSNLTLKQYQAWHTIKMFIFVLLSVLVWLCPYLVGIDLSIMSAVYKQCSQANILFC